MVIPDEFRLKTGADISPILFARKHQYQNKKTDRFIGKTDFEDGSCMPSWVRQCEQGGK